MSSRYRSLSGSAIFAATVLIAALNFALGERVREGGGFGWDGVIYRELVLHPITSNPNYSVYSAVRLVPSVLVRVGLQAFGQPLSDRSILRGFAVLDFCLILISVLLFLRICSALQIDGLRLWLAYLAVFVNYFMLKHVVYMPVLVDLSGFACGMALLFCYLTRRMKLLLVLTVVSAFTWPTAMYQGLLLYLFPVAEAKQEGSGYRGGIAAAAISTGITAYILYLLFVDRWRIQSIPVLEPCLLLSAGVVWAHLFFGVRTAADVPVLRDPRHVLRHLARWRVLPAAVAFGLVRLGVHYIASHNTCPTQVDTGVWLRYNYVPSSVAQPGIALVAHTVFFGPIVIVALLCWPGLCRVARNWGPGFSLVLLLGVVMSVASESRQFANLFPFFALAAVKATDDFRLSSQGVAVLAVLSVLFSKVWLRMNTAPMGGDVRDFPSQYLFMNLGPFMSNTMYLAQLAAMIVGTAAIRAFVLCEPLVTCGAPAVTTSPGVPGLKGQTRATGSKRAR